MLVSIEQESSILPPSISHINKFKSASSGNENNDENEESVSENDLDNIVGVTDSSEIEVRAFNDLCCLFVVLSLGFA